MEETIYENIIPVGYKKCSGCSCILPLNYYSKCKNKLKSKCKSCTQKDQIDYRDRKKCVVFVKKDRSSPRPYRRQSISKIKERIYNIHGDTISIVEKTFVDISTKCSFIDKEYGLFFSTPNRIINRKQTHPKRGEKKRKNTCLLKYGSEFPLQSDTIRNKTNATNFTKLGVKTPFESKKIQKKVKKTVYKKYGVKYIGQFKEGRKKFKQTCLIKYGVEHFSQDPTIALKISKSSSKAFVLCHWKTGKEIVCVASYEKK